MEKTFFSVKGRVTRVVKAGDDAVAFFYVRDRRSSFACCLRTRLLPAEYINQVVQPGNLVSVSGEIHGPFHDVCFVSTTGLRERVRLFWQSLALGFAAGVRIGVRMQLPAFEGVNVALLRVWVERQRERWSSVRRFLNGKR